MAGSRRRFAGVAAALAAAALLAGCITPSLELPGSGPEAPNVSVTVNTTVNGVPAAGGETVTVKTPEAGAASATGSREGQAASRQAGATAQGGGKQPPVTDDVVRPVDSERAAAIDRAVQALTALSEVELQEVCAVMCPVPK